MTGATDSFGRRQKDLVDRGGVNDLHSVITTAPPAHQTLHHLSVRLGLLDLVVTGQIKVPELRRAHHAGDIKSSEVAAARATHSLTAARQPWGPRRRHASILGSLCRPAPTPSYDETRACADLGGTESVGGPA